MLFRIFRASKQTNNLAKMAEGGGEGEDSDDSTMMSAGHREEWDCAEESWWDESTRNMRRQLDEVISVWDLYLYVVER